MSEKTIIAQLTAQLDDLRDNRDKLLLHYNSTVFTWLDKEEQVRVMQQLRLMRELILILEDRIKWYKDNNVGHTLVSDVSTVSGQATDYYSTRTGNRLFRKERMFFFRGRYYSGLLDGSALFDDPEDSFCEHIKIPTALSRGLIVKRPGRQSKVVDSDSSERQQGVTKRCRTLQDLRDMTEGFTDDMRLEVPIDIAYVNFDGEGMLLVKPVDELQVND